MAIRKKKSENTDPVLEFIKDHSALVIVLISGLLYYVGTIAQEDYFQYWGLNWKHFPKPFYEIVYLGFTTLGVVFFVLVLIVVTLVILGWFYEHIMDYLNIKTKKRKTKKKKRYFGFVLLFSFLGGVGIAALFGIIGKTTAYIEKNKVGKENYNAYFLDKERYHIIDCNNKYCAVYNIKTKTVLLLDYDRVTKLKKRLEK